MRGPPPLSWAADLGLARVLLPAVERHRATDARTCSAKWIFSAQERDLRIFCHRACVSSSGLSSLMKEPFSNRCHASVSPWRSARRSIDDVIWCHYMHVYDRSGAEGFPRPAPNSGNPLFLGPRRLFPAPLLRACLGRGGSQTRRACWRALCRRYATGFGVGLTSYPGN